MLMVKVISTYGSGQHSYTILFLFPGIPDNRKLLSKDVQIIAIFFSKPISDHSPFSMKLLRSPPVSYWSFRSS